LVASGLESYFSQKPTDAVAYSRRARADRSRFLGHLLLGQYFLGMDQERFGLSFDAAIHTGTVLAVV